MKRFHGLVGTLLVPLFLGLASSCSAGDGDDSEGDDSSSDGDGDVPVDPVTGVPTGTTSTSEAVDDNTPSSFDSYTSSCEEQVCTEEETCQETRTGTDCMRLCPGQPCPPGDGLVSWCDRYGGVTCFPG